jgi:hypothetical protein
MEIELCPTVSLLPETFNVLVAPVELMAGAINSHPELQRYKILFISGNYSRILSRLNRNITELDVRRAFTSFQLMTILEENHHSFLIQGRNPRSTRIPGRNVGLPGPVPNFLWVIDDSLRLRLYMCASVEDRRQNDNPKCSINAWAVQFFPMIRKFGK